MINQILASATKGQPEPYVGMGATILRWSDRSPATIVEVGVFRKMPMIVVQDDNAKRIDKNGMSECQEYEYSPAPNGAKTRFAFDGLRWRQLYERDGKVKMMPKGDGNGLAIGYRQKYHDFSF